MELHLLRTNLTDSFTEGHMLFDGQWYAYTLELPKLHNGAENVPDQCCIPPGRYEVIVTESPHLTAEKGFPVYRPHVMNVPGRDGILIHGGNTVRDSLGCVLVGVGKQGDGFIYRSLADDVTTKLQAAPGSHVLIISEVV